MKREDRAEPLPLGLFVGGFRWSGSGAVSDWLAGHEGLCQLRGSEAAFGEIRALNYGMRYLAQTASRRINYGERLGRWAICPDPRQWRTVLGPSLSMERGRFSLAYWVIDALFISVARFGIIPGLRMYKPLLDAQLGQDFRCDAEYLEAVGAFAEALRAFMMSNSQSDLASHLPWDDPAVCRAASGIVAVFYKRLGTDSMIPIFDNAFSGINPDLFRLLSPELFSRKVLLLVRRDPRDQFADLVRYSGSTYPWNVRSFIKQYRIAQYRTAQFLERMRDEPGTMVRLLGFEEFVLDSSGARTALQADLRLFWEQDGFGPSGLWGQGAFHPEISAKNIGLWQESRHHGAMKLISRELREYLVPESERAVASAISKG